MRRQAQYMRDLTRFVDTLFAPEVTEQFPVQSHFYRSFVIHLSCVVILRCQSPKKHCTRGATDFLQWVAPERDPGDGPLTERDVAAPGERNHWERLTH